MKNSKKLAIIGLSVILAAALLFFGINYLKGVNIFHATNYYYATYTNVNGLQVSAPVNVNGLKVGQVREINYIYDNPGHVKVEMALDRDLRVPKGSVASIAVDILGTATINLVMPQSTDYLPVGSDIEGTLQPGLMDVLGGDMLPKITALIPTIDSILTSVNVIASDPALIASIRRLDAITANLETTTASLNAAAKPLPAVVTDAKQITDNLKRMTLHLDSLSASLNQMPLNETMTNIKAITDNLKVLTQELQSSESTLGLLLHDPRLYNDINATVNSLDSLFIDIKAHPKRYLKFSVF